MSKIETYVEAIVQVRDGLKATLKIKEIPVSVKVEIRTYIEDLNAVIKLLKLFI